MKAVHNAVLSAAHSEDRVGTLAPALVARHGKAAVLEATSDLANSTGDRRVDRRLEKLAAAVEQTPMQARKNFGALFGQKYDMDAHIAVAQSLVAPYRGQGVADFLVHAPGKGGRGKAWYWLRHLQKRDFTEAPDASFPVRYFTDSKPWSQMRSTLKSYGVYVRPRFVVLDTFENTAEGPLTLDTIAARNNPDFSALRGQAQQHLSLMQREGRKAAKSATQKAISFADTAKNEAQLAAAQAKFAALRTTWNSLNLYCGPEGPESLTIERAIEEVKRAESRVGRTRRNPSAGAGELYEALMQLLAQLFSLKNYTWTAHWNAAGATSYSDHLLFQRIYEKLDKRIDKLGEYVVSTTRRPVDYALLVEHMQGQLAASQASTKKAPSTVRVRLEVSKTRMRAEQVRQLVLAQGTAAGATLTGLDNFLADLISHLDTYIYLLDQREST
jgi:DNA-binding ferritin-like protein